VEKQRVSSSTVISIGYDARTQTLEIEFGSGCVYQYYGVPDRMLAEIMQASSKCQFFNTYIKNAYAFSRVA
jgi:hypothetical protein